MLLRNLQSPDDDTQSFIDLLLAEPITRLKERCNIWNFVGTDCDICNIFGDRAVSGRVEEVNYHEGFSEAAHQEIGKILVQGAQVRPEFPHVIPSSKHDTVLLKICSWETLGIADSPSQPSNWVKRLLITYQ